MFRGSFTALASRARSHWGAKFCARAGLTEKRTWATKFEMRSPRYTIQVTELPTAHA